MWTLHLLAEKDLSGAPSRSSPRTSPVKDTGLPLASAVRPVKKRWTTTSTQETGAAGNNEEGGGVLDSEGLFMETKVELKQELREATNRKLPQVEKGDEALEMYPQLAAQHGDIEQESEKGGNTSLATQTTNRERNRKVALPNPWAFSEEDMVRWPALRKRNFWCIQRHSATALHYDLRMQLDGATVSWAVPKGLIGIAKNGESSRMAVETTLHPISYTTFEGSDGRVFSAGRRGGTLLWDIGTYEITRPYGAEDSDSESDSERARRKRRRRLRHYHVEEEDDGRYHEDQFRLALYRPVGYGKSRSIHFTLKDGIKMTDHSYILILSGSSPIASSMTTTGKLKKTWFLRLPRGIDGYPWDRGGEDGDHYGRSVKSGRTFKEVCKGPKGSDIGSWEEELKRFRKWSAEPDTV